MPFPEALLPLPDFLKQMALSSQFRKRYPSARRIEFRLAAFSWDSIRSASLLLLVASIFLCGCGSESAKWDLAQANNLYEDGDLNGAIESLETACQKSPENERIKLELAQRYAENGQCELGIGLCNDYLKHHPDDVRGFAVRAECWRFLGKFDEALADYKRSLSDHVSRSKGELNNLAYFRGLADKEIDKATLDIVTAINQVEMETRGNGVRIPFQVQTLVAASLVSRHTGQREKAVVELDKKIGIYEGKVFLANDILKTQITNSLRYRDELTQVEEKNLLQHRLNLQREKESLTAMLAVRALIFEDLGEQISADRDRLAIEELDFDFQKVCNRFPSDFNCLRVLGMASTFLDTRGFVLGRQKWTNDNELEALSVAPAEAQILFSNYEEALSDLNLAVLAVDLEHLALESPLCNSTDLSTEQIKEWKKANKRNWAVLLHHRKEIHLREGNKVAAESDQKAIDELGFNDSSLF